MSFQEQVFRWMPVLFLILASCSAQPSIQPAMVEPLPSVTSPVSPAATATEELIAQTSPKATPISEDGSPVSTDAIDETMGMDQPEADSPLIHQWPVRSVLEPVTFDDIVTGAPEKNFVCEKPYLADLPEVEGEIILTLFYEKPLRPQRVNLIQGENLGGVQRVELFNSYSGLGEVVFEAGQPASRQKLSNSSCAEIVSLPTEADFDVDTIFISFKSLADVFRLDTVELIGYVYLYNDLPVFWRVPTPHDSLADPDGGFPGGLATDNLNTLFLANGRNGLQRFDVEGNLMQSYVVPSESYLSDVAVDANQSIVVTDGVYGWFINLSPEGVQLNAGGEGFGWNNPKAVAISPIDNNIYLLNVDDTVSQIRIYSIDTAQWIRDIPLEETGEFGYKGLAFDTAGYLYTISINEAVIIKIDPNNGEQIQSLGYDVLNRTSPADLAIDEKGNIYVLMNTNPDNSAVVILDSHGSLIQRLGGLSYDGSNWREGVFLFPVSLAVTADGHFLFICENGFLTAYWLEP